MRVDIARAILENKDLTVFDEFTSVVDRNVAKISSFAIQKAIRRANKKFIAVGCHFDIEDWLLPDWVFDTNTMTFRLCEGQKKNRPKLNFKLYEAKDKSYYWNMFKKYHYLNHVHNNAARVFIGTIDDNVCAFMSVLAFPHPVIKNVWRAHRIVVLPDFQGIGLGNLLVDTVGEILKESGKSLFVITSNPAMITIAKKSPKWIITRKGREAKNREKRQKNGPGSSERITASLKYIG